MIEDEEKNDEDAAIGDDVLEGLGDDTEEEDDPLMAEETEDDKDKDWM